TSTLCPYTTLFRSVHDSGEHIRRQQSRGASAEEDRRDLTVTGVDLGEGGHRQIELAGEIGAKILTRGSRSEVLGGVGVEIAVAAADPAVGDVDVEAQPPVGGAHPRRGGK